MRLREHYTFDGGIWIKGDEAEGGSCILGWRKVAIGRTKEGSQNCEISGGVEPICS
jgi:hypothetical protein